MTSEIPIKRKPFGWTYRILLGLCILLILVVEIKQYLGTGHF